MKMLILMALLLELVVWIIAAQFISGWYIFFWFIIAMMIGAKMIFSSLSSIRPELQRMQLTGHASFDGLVGKRLMTAIAGLLLVVPGLVSDLLAVIVLLPFTQKIAKSIALSALAKRQQQMMEQMMKNMGGAGHPFSDLMQQQMKQYQQDDSIIEGEAREIKPEQKRINAPK